MISNTVIAFYVIFGILGIALPVTLAIIWCVKTKQPFWVVLVGAATFFVFALILESVPKIFLFQISSPVSKAILANAWLTTIVGALLAGIFEETGRFVSFKFLLKKRTERRTSITYGIGHGGFEVMFLLAYGAIQNLVLIMIINSGQFDALLDTIALTAPDQLEAYKALPASYAAVNFSTVLLSLFERTSAVMIHIACSIIVYMAVRGKKNWMFPLAILLHASIDLFAGMYQTGIIKEILVLEIGLFIWALAFLTVTLIFVYKKMPKDYNEEKTETQ